VVVLNTCAVRENADNKLYGNLGHLASVKAKHPGMQIAVGGCLAQKDRGLILEKAPWVDVVFGTHNLGSLPALLARARHNESAQIEIAESLEAFPSSLPTRRDSAYSAWVSISVGCNNSCTFCIVPALRGKEVDRRPGDILAEVEALVADGVLEITFLGQNVNSYGVDFGDRGAFERCEAVLSGYQGAEEVGAVVLDAVAKVKAVSPRAIYCCDPVMGDVGRGMFVRPGIPEFMRDQVVPAADVITPNHFELDFLAGVATSTYDELLDAVDSVRSRGPGTVLVTSTILDDTPDEALDMVAVSDQGAWRTRFPRLPVSPPGAGDLTTAVFLANLLDGRPLDEALARTTASVFAVVDATAAAGEHEMRIVQTQEELASPTRTFAAVRLR